MNFSGLDPKSKYLQQGIGDESGLDSCYILQERREFQTENPFLGSKRDGSVKTVKLYELL